MYVRHAAFIQNADCFDALIFGISGAEVQFGWKLGLLQIFFSFELRARFMCAYIIYV